MSQALIDHAILESVGESWSKVAMVIARASMKRELAMDEEQDVIAKRIEALITDGHLEVQGDIKDWRHSEVRISASPLVRP